MKMIHIPDSLGPRSDTHLLCNHIHPDGKGKTFKISTEEGRETYSSYLI